MQNPNMQNSNDPWQKQDNNGLPDLEQAWKTFKQRLFSKSSGGSDDNKKPNLAITAIIITALIVVWSLMGFYTINSQERGVVLRLGKYTETLQPGLQWQPYLFDKVTKVNVTKLRTFSSHGFMLTVDENIIELTLKVQYYISDPKELLFNIYDPEVTLSNATDSVIRHVIGSTTMDNILTEGREQAAQEIIVRLQKYADKYKAGIKISKINIENTQAPQQVQHAFDDVIKAREDKEKFKNQALTYVNSVVPQARGTALRQLEDAKAYKAKIIASAQGEAYRFNQLLIAYQKAPKVTRDRLYIDTMEQILSTATKVVVNVKSGNNIMYLPLDKFIQQRQAGNTINKLEMPQSTTSELNNNLRKGR